MGLVLGSEKNANFYKSLREKINRGEIVKGLKKNQFGPASEALATYGLLLEDGNFIHYRDMEVSMGTTGYQLESIGSV